MRTRATRTTKTCSVSRIGAAATSKVSEYLGRFREAGWLVAARCAALGSSGTRRCRMLDILYEITQGLIFATRPPLAQRCNMQLTPMWCFGAGH